MTVFNFCNVFWPFIYISAFKNGFQSARLRFHVYVGYIMHKDFHDISKVLFCAFEYRACC